MAVRFHELLHTEFASRKAKNARYSMRAFATLLEVDHSTLAQVLRSARPVPAGRIRSWARKLGLTADEAAVYVAASHAPSLADSEREHQLQHWTAEALAVMNEAAHFEILRLTREGRFEVDVRWISRETGLSVDQINTALARLLRLRLIEMRPHKWRDVTGLTELTGAGFRKLALDRVRKSAADYGIKFGRKAKHE